MRGITKRWLINTFGVILIILFILVVAFAIIIQNSYYSRISQTLNGRSSELVNIFNDTDDFLRTARVYVENFPDKELMELMVRRVSRSSHQQALRLTVSRICPIIPPR